MKKRLGNGENNKGGSEEGNVPQTGVRKCTFPSLTLGTGQKRRRETGTRARLGRHGRRKGTSLSTGQQERSPEATAQSVCLRNSENQRSLGKAGRGLTADGSQY